MGWILEVQSGSEEAGVRGVTAPRVDREDGTCGPTGESPTHSTPQPPALLRVSRLKAPVQTQCWAVSTPSPASPLGSDSVHYALHENALSRD